MRKKRLDLKLLQKDVAQKLGVNKTSLCNWENNRASPSLHQLPKIVKFLGYIPYDPSTKTPGQKIATFRRLLGITQKELAQRLGIDPTTLGRWERGFVLPKPMNIFKLAALYRTMTDALFIDLLRSVKEDIHQKEEGILKAKK